MTESDCFPEWRLFEERVVQAYRALGYEVTHDINVGGKQADLICRRYIPGAGQATLFVDCKLTTGKSVANNEVESFLYSFISNRERNGWTHGVVVSNKPFSQHAKAIAAQHPAVSLKHIDELEADGFRYFDYANHTSRESARDPVLSTYYVDLDACPIDPATSRKGTRSSLDGYVRTWLTSDYSSQLWLLGDFGSGKTTYLRNLHLRLVKAWQSGAEGRMSIFVPLRNYDQSLDAAGLAQEICKRQLDALVSQRTFEAFAKAGKFIFLYDGFDEMAKASNKGIRRSLYTKLTRAAMGSKTILTCRPGYFVGREELRGLAEYLHSEYGAGTPTVALTDGRSLRSRKVTQMIASTRDTDISAMQRAATAATAASEKALAYHVELFDEGKIRQFLERYRPQLSVIDPEGHWTTDRLIDTIHHIYDLGDLAKRPILLQLVAETLPQLRIEKDGTFSLRTDHREIHFGAITPTILYFAYTDRELSRERNKTERPLLISKEELRAFLVRLASGMVEIGRTSLSHTELTRRVFEVFRPSEERLDWYVTYVRACSFLSPSGFGDDFRFVHKSFLEYFAAESFVDALMVPRVLEERMSTNSLPYEVAYFLGSRVAEFHSDAIPSLRHIAASSDYPIARCNALNVLSAARSPEPLVRGLKAGALRFPRVDAAKLAFESSRIVDLQLLRSVVDSILLQDVHVRRLMVEDCTGTEGPARVVLTKCSVGRLHTAGGCLEFIATGSVVSRWSLQGTEAQGLTLQKSRVHLEAFDTPRTPRLTVSDSVVSAGTDGMATPESEMRVDSSKSVVMGLRISVDSGSYASTTFVRCRLGTGEHEISTEIARRFAGCAGYFLCENLPSCEYTGCPSWYSVQFVRELKDKILNGVSGPMDLAERLRGLTLNERIAVAFPCNLAEFGSLSTIEVNERIARAKGPTLALAEIILGKAVTDK